jgi:hypothetical protein
VPHNLEQLNKQALLSTFKELANNEEGFRSIAEFEPVMLWMADAEGKSKFLNKNYLHFSGANDDSDLSALLRRCDEIREKIKLMDIEYRGQKLGTITISIDVALFPDHGETSENLTSAADAAMYIAKRNGRDQVVLAQKPTIPH